MEARPRIDLDGVALTGERDTHMSLAIFRHRTDQGLVFLIPESADVLVPWEYVRWATVDLAAGAVRVDFDPRWAAEQHWLRGSTTLSGPWLDRFQLKAPPLAR